MDVIPQGLIGLLLATRVVLGIPSMDVCPLEVPYEDHLEVHLVVDAAGWKKFEPRPNMFPNANGKVLNDEVVIIHSSGLAGEPKVYEPYTRVCLPGILGDVGRRSEALSERRFLDASAKGPWSRAIRAGTPVVGSVTVPRVRLTGPLDGPAGARTACSHRRPVNAIIVPGLTSVVDDTTSVLVWPKAFAHRRPMWGQMLS